MTLMKRMALAALLALPATAGLAQGVTHTVIVERYGFFPQPVYVQPGDTIVFENRAPNWTRIWSEDSNDNMGGYSFNDPCDTLDPDGDNQPEYSGARDGFNTPWFNVGQTRTITVTACMETRFFEPEVWQYSFDNNARIDLIVFGHAPTGS